MIFRGRAYRSDATAPPLAAFVAALFVRALSALTRTRPMAYFQTENLWVNRLADGVAELVLDVSGSKVNVPNRAVLS